MNSRRGRVWPAVLCGLALVFVARGAAGAGGPAPEQTYDLGRVGATVLTDYYTVQYLLRECQGSGGDASGATAAGYTARNRALVDAVTQLLQQHLGASPNDAWFNRVIDDWTARLQLRAAAAAQRMLRPLSADSRKQTCREVVAKATAGELDLKRRYPAVEATIARVRGTAGKR